ncbi:PH domain-containing protein|uniref:PH domain-containing protein n=1 Tax=Leuconostoc lactis TaxID=1246 RepID=A0A6L7AAF0_LEULA|nr:PH domain-containing protein [Leuconostoc lactis]
MMADTPWFTKRQYYVRRDKIQRLNAAQSIFMGPRQAQHLQVVVRHGDSAAHIDLRYLQADVVAQVRRWLRWGLGILSLVLGSYWILASHWHWHNGVSDTVMLVVAGVLLLAWLLAAWLRIRDQRLTIAGDILAIQTTVSVFLASAVKSDKNEAHQTVLMPVIQTAEATQVLRPFLPTLPLPALQPVKTVPHALRYQIQYALYVVIFLGIGVAFLKIYNQYYGFTLSRVGQHLAISRGLLTKHTMQLRTTRVQAVQLEQSLLRRALRLGQASATYQIDQRALIRYALTSFGSLGIIGVILTLLSEVSNHLPESVMAGLDHWLSGGSLMFYATLTRRVQTLTKTQPFIFQPFEVFQVRIETSGKADDQLTFNALTPAQIATIERYRQAAQTTSVGTTTTAQLLLPFVFVMLQGRRDFGQQALWTGGFLLIALVFGVVKWFFFTYELTPHEITVHQGVFVKRRTHVPFDICKVLSS